MTATHTKTNGQGTETGGRNKTTSTRVPDTGLITAEMKAQYQEEGYLILKKVIPEELLIILREECSYFLGYADAELDSADKKTRGLNHRGSRYFISNRYRFSGRLWQFIFSQLMAELTYNILGEKVFLFNEQWVVKGPEKGMKFGWHQDSGYVKHGETSGHHKPYLTCWCPLDDVNEENGTVYLLPHSRGGTKECVFDHVREDGSNDLIGYEGDDPGIPIVVPAGSIVAFSSYNFHRSGANTTPNMRRVYLPQYSAEPILNTAGERRGLAVPFIENGRVIYDRQTDTAKAHGGVPVPGE